MSNFALDTSSSQGDIISSLNYALANLGSTTTTANTAGNVLTANTTTGVISTTGGGALSYLYQYMDVAYANTATGGGFTSNCFNTTYYGVHNNTANVADTNPTDYQWTQVAGGFGTTKGLYYQTLGGRQIAFTVGSSQPGYYYRAVQDSIPINLDNVTTVQAIYSATVYQRGNTTPATPTGGTYDFGNLILTAPAGWSATVPNTDANLYLYGSQNTFLSTQAFVNGPSTAWSTPSLFFANGSPGAPGAAGANGVSGTSTYYFPAYYANVGQPTTPTGGSWNFTTSTGTPPTGWNLSPPTLTGNLLLWSSYSVANIAGNTGTASSLTWSTPVQLSGNVGTTGNTGSQGSRGFIPMAYVVTSSDPTSYTNTQYTTAFSANRSNIAPPIGTGFAPITGDTAQFVYTPTNTIVVKTFNANTSAWTAANGQVISGNVFVTGSINATALNANDVYALNIASTNATVGNFNSPGFWLQANTGNARIAGNTSIGNNLSVGANAAIGANLTIGNNALIGNNLGVGNLAVIGNQLTVGTNANIGNNLIVGDNALIGNNLGVGNAAVVGNYLVVGTNAQIGNNLTIGNNLAVGNFGTIGANLSVGQYLQVGTNAYIGNNLGVGNNAVIGNSLVIGNNTTIGNNLYVGNNAQIGANLAVAGLITASSLQANTVITTTMVPNSVNGIYSITQTGETANIASPSPASAYFVGGNLTISNVTPGTSTFIVSASEALALNFYPYYPQSGAGQWPFYLVLRVQAPSGTIYQTLVENDLIVYSSPISSVLSQFLYLVSAQIGPFPSEPAGTYKFYLEMAFNYYTYGNPVNYLTCEGYTFTVQQVKR